MNLLLDAHAVVWYLAGDTRMSLAARNAVSDTQNRKWVSAASLWEIAIKVSLGKIQLSQPFDQLFPAYLDSNEIQVLALNVPHLSRLLTLPNVHKDPFDRIIVAQAMVESLTVVTCDGEIPKYPVATLW